MLQLLFQHNSSDISTVVSSAMTENDFGLEVKSSEFEADSMIAQ